MHDMGGFPEGDRNPYNGPRSPFLRPDMPHLPLVTANGRTARGFLDNPLVAPLTLQLASAHAPCPVTPYSFRCALDGVGMANQAGTITTVVVTRDYGRTWALVPSPSQEQNSNANNGLGVWMMNSSSGGAGTTTLWSFDNAQSFVQKTGPFTGFQYAAGYNNGRFFVGQYSATQLYWTDNFGATWTMATLPTSQHMRHLIGDGLNTVIVTGEFTTTLQYTKDNGKTWHAGGAGLFGSTAPLFARGKFWWPCGANQFIEYTEDCINIKRAYLPTTSGTWTSLGWSPAGYFILSGTADQRILLSKDGLDWFVNPTLSGQAINYCWNGNLTGFSGLPHGGTRALLIDFT